VSNYDTASKVIAGKILGDHVKVALDDYKTRMLHHMRTGDRIIGEHQGVRLGGITKCEGRKRAVVVDETAFVTWVMLNYHMETLTTVREPFRKKLLDHMLHDGCDPKTGVVVPGVEIREGDPYLMVRPTPEGKAWVQNQFGLILPAIEQ
jgi:hypothetical protein